MPRPHLLALLSLLPALALLTACGGGHKDEEIDGVVVPDIEFARFALGVKHVNMHLVPGNNWDYESTTAAGLERTRVEVLLDERTFPEVAATTVETSVMLADVPLRDSTDWFAEDNTGAVWQFGKDACDYQNGECVSNAGSWEWSGGDARPGIVLPANPEVGKTPHYQVYWKDHVEDVGEVIAVGESVSVPGGDFKNCVKIRQTSNLDSTIEQIKYYCPIVGLTLIEDGDVRVELMHFGGV